MEIDRCNELMKTYKRDVPSPERILLEQIFRKGTWPAFAYKWARKGQCTPELKEAFHLLWIERGHFIRSRLKNDRKLLKVLRALLPAYGGEGLWLYRGENLDTYHSGKLGFCWTTDENVAIGFARGFNNFGSGGVLVKAWAPASSILAGMHPHSENWLQEKEITVDWFSIEKLVVIQEFQSNE